MINSFFSNCTDKRSIALRLRQLREGKVGFYSVGLYPASLAYNCAMHGSNSNLLLAARPGRKLLGAFSELTLSKLDHNCVRKMTNMSSYFKDGKLHTNTLEDLIKKCELVVLSANSNHIEEDLKEALRLRALLKRENVLLACLVGSFTYDNLSNSPSLLCQSNENLAFFSGFHRHAALRNPSDSFTANFCHPDSLNALLGARLLDNLSTHIQVSSGVHNIEGQYIKAVKNISSIFAGFAHTFHQDHPGLLPTLLTLLLHQCLDQAAIVSVNRNGQKSFYSDSSLPLTEIGYGVQKIEAALSREGNMHTVRDHTFIQLTAMIADVKGSMMLPVSGSPTRNFQVGQVLASNMLSLGRCPIDLTELIDWCSSFGLARGGLEGVNSLQYWPKVLEKYSISYQDSSMLNLLYMSIYASKEIKHDVFKILTDSRNLTLYCQESVRPDSSLRLNQLLNNLDQNDIIAFIADSLLNNSFNTEDLDKIIYAKNQNVDSHINSPSSILKKYFNQLCRL